MGYENGVYNIVSVTEIEPCEENFMNYRASEAIHFMDVLERTMKMYTAWNSDLGTFEYASAQRSFYYAPHHDYTVQSDDSFVSKLFRFPKLDMHAIGSLVRCAYPLLLCKRFDMRIIKGEKYLRYKLCFIDLLISKGGRQKYYESVEELELWGEKLKIKSY